MDDPDLTEKIPRDLDSEDSDPGNDDVPITVTPPRRASEIPPLPPTRAARGTRTSITVPPPHGNRRRATLPPPIPSAARGSTASIPVPPVPNPAPQLFTTANSAPSKLIPFLPPADDAPITAAAPVPPPPVAVRAPAPPPPLPRAIRADEEHAAAA